MSASTVDRTYVETLVAGRPQIHVEAHARDFSVRTRLAGGVQVVDVCGELDMATAPLLRSVLGMVRERLSRRVQLDLSGVTFLDEYALAFLHLAVRSSGGRSLTVLGPSPAVLRAGERTGPEEDSEVADRRSWRESRRVG